MESNKLFTAVERFSNQTYELFEQYLEGRFDRIQLNKLMVDATNKAKEMEKQQMMDCYLKADVFPRKYEFEQYYKETYKQD